MSSNSPVNDKGAQAVAEPFVFAPPSGPSGGRLGGAAGWKTSEKSPGASDLPGEQRTYEKGLTDGEGRARVAFEKNSADLRGSLSETLRQFVLERESYFQRFVGEVVQLALSIARKILHREAQIDPLLLTGIVRLALDSLNEGTHVRLRTNPQEILSWSEYFSQVGGTTPPPELRATLRSEPVAAFLKPILAARASAWRLS